MKYVDTKVTFREIPNEISLSINISNCPFNCDGCHSPELRKDIGRELNIYSLGQLIQKNQGITCVCFLGGDADPGLLFVFSDYVRYSHKLKTAWYSGRDAMHVDAPNHFDYIKIGHYDKNLGPLDSPTTNQKLFRTVIVLDDITMELQHGVLEDKKLEDAAKVKNITS